MSEHPGSSEAAKRRDRLRPLELLGFSAFIAIAIGVIVFFAARRFELAVLWSGVSFIVILVVVAMLMLAASPEPVPGDADDDAGPRMH